MRAKPAAYAQLPLTLPLHESPVAMSAELERQLVTALADLLVAVARAPNAPAWEGGSDERENRR